jgi:hypothetical protein
VRRELSPHPETPPGVSVTVHVEVRQVDETWLNLEFHIVCDIDALVLPAPAEPARADGLWQHSCFEAFLREDSSPAYWEFNFAPSRSWAAYRFEDYRSGMREAEFAPPLIEAVPAAREYRLSVSIQLPPSEGAGRWRLGLAAVIEEADGRKSYWALAHPAKQPDFHHPASFAAELDCA